MFLIIIKEIMSTEKVENTKVMNNLQERQVIGKESSLGIDFCQYNNDQYCARNPFLCSGIDYKRGGAAKVSVINPELYKNNVAKDYVKIPANATPSGRPGYSSEDARLKNPLNGNMPMVLDRRPMNMSVEAIETDDVYSDKLKEVHTGYKSYKKLNQGQITYYVDHELTEPFTRINFQMPAHVSGFMTVTPMNTLEARFTRKPAHQRDCLDTSLCKKDYAGCLSWMEDSLEQRENIMASQMWGINKNKWEARWNPAT